MFKKNDNMQKRTYCPLAWTHSFINQDGSYQVCCSSEEFDNFIRNNQNEKMYIQEGHTSSDVMNSNFMKELRLKMLNGQWPSLCERCRLTEELGGTSRRQVEIRSFENQNQNFIESTAPDGHIKTPVTSLDYRLGNLCNLQCRMCNPRSTKLWIKEWNQLKPKDEQFSPETMDSYNKYDWINSPKLIEDFKQKAKNLTHIHFAGGEPLLAPQMSAILETCIASKNAANITITYNTNLTILPQKILNLWKHFKGVKILASIDAIGELNNYIRHFSQWDKIDQNLKFIEKNHQKYKIEECMLSVTVQALNVLRLNEIYEYLEQFNFLVPVPNLINLHVPQYYQTKILPPKVKFLASQRLKNIKERYENKIPSYYKYLTDNISHIIEFMNSENHFQKDLFYQFLKFQTQFDHKKKITLSDAYPEFKMFLEK